MNFFLTVKMGKRASEEARERERERSIYQIKSIVITFEYIQVPHA